MTGTDPTTGTFVNSGTDPTTGTSVNSGTDPITGTTMGPVPKTGVIMFTGPVPITGFLSLFSFRLLTYRLRPQINKRAKMPAKLDQGQRPSIGSIP